MLADYFVSFYHQDDTYQESYISTIGVDFVRYFIYLCASQFYIWLAFCDRFQLEHLHSYAITDFTNYPNIFV